jgi:hypothetical protein
LRALAIGSLINDAVKVFVENEAHFARKISLCLNGQKQIQSTDG